MKFNEEKYKVHTRKSMMMLHWIINPGLAINELIFGQRLPKISLEDKTSSKPRIERYYTPCPSCNKIHDSRTWSIQNKTAFKNWFGLYCINCNNIIPCVRNGLSIVILFLTFPFWIWFRKSLKDNWLSKQPKRFENLDFKSAKNPYEGLGWVKHGLGFGLIMYIVMTLIYPLIINDPITLRRILLSIPLWTICGLLYGYIMKFSTKK